MISMLGRLEKRHPRRATKSNPETEEKKGPSPAPPGSTNSNNNDNNSTTTEPMNAQVAVVPPQREHEEDEPEDSTLGSAAENNKEHEWIWKGEWIFTVAESDRTANRFAFEYTWRSRNVLPALPADNDDEVSQKKAQQDDNEAATSSNAENTATAAATAATTDTVVDPAIVNSGMPPAGSASAPVSAAVNESQNPTSERPETKEADITGDSAAGQERPPNVTVNVNKDESKEMEVERPSSESNNTIDREASHNLASKPEMSQQQTPSRREQSTKSDTEPGNSSATSFEFRGHTLPESGKWEGSFDTLVGRKGQQRKIVVPESFSMNWNLTPADLSKVSIRLEQHEPLPENHVFVSGRGENQYGPFEFVGSLDLATFQLQCQKQYVVVVPQEPRKEEPPSRIATRKRQLSWKRRYDEMDFGVTATGEATMATTSGGNGTAATGSVSNKRPRKMQAPAQPAGGGGSSTSSIPTSTSVAATGMKKLTVTIPGGRTTSSQPSPVVMPSGPKKRPPATTTSTTTATAASSGSSAGYIKLPTVGDPLKARWRAAHFLYYHDVDQQPPTASPRDTGSGSTAQQQSQQSQPQQQPPPQQIQQAQQQQPKFIVYEGELLFSKREGRGVCLYNSGLIYEGDWKRDKEHGVGTLSTSDRQRVIYKGEWERGRMHGRGTYYYYYNYKTQPHAKAKTNVTANSWYEGEFKENLRHGMGKYVLPDGSKYEGQWREGAMCGRGVFTWPDGSIYDGEWKEGKRHGAGILRTSEGFVYDGNWTLNTMEGRGTATYPNGQQYNGLFSRGKREGRGTILFTNGAVYEGRFRDDAIDGQGTMKMSRTTAATTAPDAEGKHDFMIPLSFQSDIGHIHHKAGFTHGGH